MTKKLQKNILELVSGLAIILLLLWVGSFISEHTGDFLPGSIIGMLLLTAGLQMGLIRLQWVEYTANQFVRWMSLLFVPIGVGLVEQLPILQDALVAILVTCIGATLALLTLIGWGAQWYARRQTAEEV